MYLLIFESIGTSELFLIGLVALIIFGPRKLPDMMKKFGKIMADFRRTTNEFKESWEREVSFENLEKQQSEEKKQLENSIDNAIGRDSYPLENEIVTQEIKEMQTDELEQHQEEKYSESAPSVEAEKEPGANQLKNDLRDKQDWL